MKRLVMIAFVAMASLGFAQGKLTVWLNWTDSNEQAWIRAQAAAFQKATGTTIDIVQIPFGESKDKFVLSAPQGQGPDLLLTVPHDWIGSMAAAGVLEPMEKFASKGYLGSLNNVTVSAMSYKGKVFSLPMFAESVALIYNKKMVKTAPKTWAEFLKVAQDNTKANTSYGFLYNLGDAYFNYGWFTAYGASVFGKDSSGGLVESDLQLGGEPGTQALNFIKDLRFKYKLIPAGIDYGAADSAFKEGKLAMILNGPWALGDYKKAGINFGIAPMPAPPGGKAWKPFVGVQGVALNAYSKNKKVAANFAKTLVTSANQVAFNKAGGRIPVSKVAASKLRADPVVAGFSKTIALGSPMPNIPQMGEVWGPWGNAIGLVTQKADSDTSKILADMIAEIKKSLAK